MIADSVGYFGNKQIWLIKKKNIKSRQTQSKYKKLSNTYICKVYTNYYNSNHFI